jgi:ABC-2 type transport system ATP-binding protein
VLQECGVQSNLTVAELVEMYGRYYRHPLAVDEVIEIVKLTEKRDEQARLLSGGQRRRLDLALALVGDPDLIFLDEPTTGFDPAARRQAWSTVRSLIGLGKTIVLTTHYMDEAQALADRSTPSTPARPGPGSTAPISGRSRSGASSACT